MSIALEKMSDSEYAEFYRRSFATHAAELVRKENLTRESAEAETRKELQEMLPDGLATADNFLYSIKQQGAVIGYLWFLTELHEDCKQAFLCDFMIYEEYRRKGFGRAALSEMERIAGDARCEECILFVEEENAIAQKLYSGVGYRMLRKHNYGAFLKKKLH